MKKHIFIFLLPLASCIQTDFEDPLPEVFMITNDIRDITFRVSESYVLNTIYTDNIGDTLDADVVWTSSDNDILSFNGDTAFCHQVGSVFITAESNGKQDTQVVEVFGQDEEVEVATSRIGELQGTGYDITGDITLEINDQGELYLIVEDYIPDGPGPYFYLSTANESRSVSGLNLGEARTSGNYEYNLSAIDSTFTLNTFDYLIVWCEPFGVRLGFGEFNN